MQGDQTNLHTFSDGMIIENSCRKTILTVDIFLPLPITDVRTNFAKPFFVLPGVPEKSLHFEKHQLQAQLQTFINFPKLKRTLIADEVNG